MTVARAGAALFTVGLVAGASALLALQIGLRVGHASPPQPWPIASSALATVDLGATTEPLARNSWRPWKPKDLISVNALEQAIHKHLGIVMWYADWAHTYPLQQQLEAVARRGSVPEITWEPWNSLRPLRDQPRYRLRNIVAGRFDRYISTWARTIAAFHKPVLLRFAQEMNGNWYPWAANVNGNRPGDFARAWEHTHRIFVAAGATNVRWIWSIARIPVSKDLYPGPRVVDFVSMTIFNGGTQLQYEPWRSFAHHLESRVARLRVIAPGKPIEISEIGCGEQGGDKAAWIRGLFGQLRRRPGIRSLIWYDLVKGCDWRIESSRKSLEAYRQGASDQRYD